MAELKASSRLLLSLFALVHTVLALDCPSGWDGYSNSCYKFVVQSLSLRGLNWENARRDCLGYGGDLVSIANQSEMSFIYGKSSKVQNQHYWIGLNDQRNESLFVWSDGTPYNASVYSNWHPGEPNDRAGEDCVELYNTRWNDNSCKKQYGYICERPKGTPLPPITTANPPVTSGQFGVACFQNSACLVTQSWGFLNVCPIYTVPPLSSAYLGSHPFLVGNLPQVLILENQRSSDS